MVHMRVDELSRMLSRYSGGFVHVCLPGGNVGDQLIYFGLRTLLREYNIKSKEFRLGKRMAGDTLFIAGSGGYCRFWNDGNTTMQCIAGYSSGTVATELR